jgi:hypothetical protein
MCDYCISHLDKSKYTSGGNEKTKEFRLPAIVPIILYNGYNNWTACRSFNVIERYPAFDHCQGAEHRIKLGDYTFYHLVGFQFVVITLDFNNHTLGYLA